MRRRRKNSGQIIFNIVGLVVVLSMVLGGLSVVLLPQSSSRATPTPFPTRPRPTLTPVPPTLTPLPTETATPTGTPIATPIPLGSTDIKKFSFAVCGDNRGGDDVYQEILRRTQEEGLAFLVNTGDLIKSGRTSQFQDFAELMSDFSLPFFPVPGNHDSPDGLLDEFIQYSGAPAAHYSFDYGSAHFVVADSHLGELPERELAWLDADLSATSQPLKIVFLHYPPFDPDGSDYILRQGNDEFMALMQKHSVSHVFAGHIHAYAQEMRDGVNYIITGGGGAPLYTTSHSQAFYHYLRVTIDGVEVGVEIVKIEDM